jgi:hypothetical protein
MNMSLPHIMISKINWQLILKIGVFFLLTWIVIGNLVVIPYGIDNIRIVYTFSSDEHTILENVIANVTNNDLNPHGKYYYGYWYHTVGFVVSKTLEHFGFKADARLIAMVLRLISWGSFILIGIVMYKLFTGPFKGTKEFGLILVLVFLSLPELSHWSRMIHPDMFQMAWIVLVAWLAFYKHTAAYLFMASAAAGAAFGTKYAGIFILPFIFLPYLFQCLSTSPSLRNKKLWLKIISVGILTVFIFLAVWLITNPYLLPNLKEFIYRFGLLKEFMGRGLAKAEPANPLLWFTTLGKTLGPVISIVVCLGIVITLGSLIITFKKNGLEKFLKDPLNRNLLTTILYIIFTFLYLMVSLRIRQARYLFHVLPFIILIAIYGFQTMGIFFKSRWLNVLIIIFFFFSSLIPATRSLTQSASLTEKYDNPRFKAGDFLAANVDEKLNILADPYSYVPLKFKHVVFRFRIDGAKIKMHQPDIIIFNFQATHRWSWKKRGTSFRDLDFKKGDYFNARHYYRFHKRLFSPRSKWEIIYETYDVVILKKKNRQLN